MAHDYLVVGAGASGLAFVDSLVDHDPDATVTIVDRRAAPGGHWRDAYPFVRLHQASVFYGVASTRLGGGELQTDGPETGLQERATAPEICAYYDAVLQRLAGTGRVTFEGGREHAGPPPEGTRVVDAHYLEPEIPATTPPPFAAVDGARVVPVGELPEAAGSASQYVVVGSGKTATDAIVWLLSGGVDPDAVCWVRPRDPWMLDRAVVQPDPAAFTGMVADVVENAAQSESLDELFLRLESSGVMLRVDPSVAPTMARTPTLARWELDLLRSVERVVRLGHVRAVRPGELELEQGRVPVARDAVVVHCAASAFPGVPTVPIWGRDAIRLQPVRSGFPCFAAALAGYVEATRDGDEEKNRLCPPSPYGNSLVDWARMTVLGYRASRAFGAEPDIAAWAQDCLLNPARVAPEDRERPDVRAAQRRVGEHAEAGMNRLAALAGLDG